MIGKRARAAEHQDQVRTVRARTGEPEAQRSPQLAVHEFRGHMPNELVLQFLRTVIVDCPIHSLNNFATVCKDWNELVTQLRTSPDNIVWRKRIAALEQTAGVQSQKWLLAPRKGRQWWPDPEYAE